MLTRPAPAITPAPGGTPIEPSEWTAAPARTRLATLPARADLRSEGFCSPCLRSPATSHQFQGYIPKGSKTRDSQRQRPKALAGTLRSDTTPNAVWCLRDATIILSWRTDGVRGCCLDEHSLRLLEQPETQSRANALAHGRLDNSRGVRARGTWHDCAHAR